MTEAQIQSIAFEFYNESTAEIPDDPDEIDLLKIWIHFHEREDALHREKIEEQKSEDGFK